MIVDKDGNLLMDFLGHYENLAEDVAYVCQKIGVNEQLPHLNQSQHKDYRDYYTDRTRELIAEHYAKDISLFGYDFDGLIAPVNP